MIKYLTQTYKQIAGSKEYSNVFRNFGFLSVIQIANYLLPLLTLPYLVNVLGAELFGQVMFAQAFTQYFVIVVEYGFNFSATREIAIHKKDTAKVSEIFFSVMILKVFLLLLSFVILAVIVLTVEKFAAFRSLYFVTFLITVGYVVFPSWFFQGLEKMKWITIINMTSKTISAVLIFALVSRPDQILYVPLILSLCTILPGLVVLFYLDRIFPLTWTLPDFKTLMSHLRSGWIIFLTSISSSLYSVSNTFLLGLLFNATYAGYYSMAEKIIRAFTAMLVPLNNALFPYMSLKMKESPGHGMKIIRRIIMILACVTAIGSVCIYLSGDLLVFVLDKKFYPSIAVLKILSPLLVIVALSNLIGYQILIATRMERKYLLTVFLAGILNLIVCFALSTQYSYKAAAIALLVSEAFICVSFVFHARKVLLLNKVI